MTIGEKKCCTTNSFLIFCVKVKGKVVSVHAMKAFGRSRSIGPFILNSVSREVNCTPQSPYSWGKYFWYMSYRKCCPQGWWRLFE